MTATVLSRRAAGLRRTARAPTGAGHEVENPRAAVALDDAVVPACLVEDLRPQPHVADGAQAVARFGHGHALAAVGDALEDRQRFGG